MNDTDNHDPSNNESTSSDPWGDEMTSEFDRRVRDLHEAPLTLDQVKGKAMTIRRKRRTAVAGGILAAAAVIVPVAALAGSGFGEDRSQDVAPGTGSPTPGETATDSPTDAPTSPPARPASPAYVDGTSFHLSDGTVFELPSAAYYDAATIGDGTVVATRRADDGGLEITTTVDLLSTDGSLLEEIPAESDFTVAHGGGSVAFVDVDGGVRVIGAGGEITLADGWSDWSVRGVVGDCTVDDDCRVALRDAQGVEAPVVLDAEGNKTEVGAGALTAYDLTDDGRLSIVDEIDDFGSCGGVLDEATDELAFRTCGFTVQHFSPSGDFVTGAPAYLDGIGDGFVAILDAATGEEVVRLEPGSDGYVSASAWIDDTTLAVQVADYIEKTWTIQLLSAEPGAQPRVVVGPVTSTNPDAEPDGPFHLVD